MTYSTAQGEVTALAKNAKDSASLRTTVPMSMVRQWQLKPRDKLLWRWEVRDNKMVAVVERYENEEQRKPKKRGTKK
ncbi:hypothetical protein [Nitrososphaera sp. AFS]|uniref:hypothetical protein n=1 Tax=Nitrososphaera sp. AFS TaxID=2301191 RepID=UPI001F18F161|nr:hypothetical protein [Nitrososphaera sp. AFS]NAL78271.1 hypothetical protein [Nitrososphaera sp. AFS]